MKHLARMFQDVDVAVEVPQLARRRRKLWELPSGWHCPLIGTCLTTSDLHLLAKRAGLDQSGLVDYALHAFIVDRCGIRSDLAEKAQKFLDQRYALSIRQVSKVKGGEAVLTFWRSAVDGGNAAEALWAVWTHPDTYDYEGAVIHGELHMLSHQLGAQGRAEQKRIHALEQNNAQLLEEVSALRRNLASTQRERESYAASVKTCLAELEQQAARFKRDEHLLASANKAEAVNKALLKRNEVLLQRLATMEQRNNSHVARLDALNSELAEARSQLKQAGDASVFLPASDALPIAEEGRQLQDLHTRLAGRRVLCIGGRTGLIGHYRRLVEASGGYFVHHDGGQEENEHRIDAIVAGVDAVVCQINHVSHPAYWRIKNACKQHGLPCLFLKSGGVTTFARNLDMLAAERIGTYPSSRLDAVPVKANELSP